MADRGRAPWRRPRPASCTGSATSSRSAVTSASRPTPVRSPPTSWPPRLAAALRWARAMGQRYYKRAWIDHTDRPHRDDPLDIQCCSLLIRRHRHTGELAFYRCYSPEPTSRHPAATVPPTMGQTSPAGPAASAIRDRDIDTACRASSNRSSFSHVASNSHGIRYSDVMPSLTRTMSPRSPGEATWPSGFCNSRTTAAHPSVPPSSHGTRRSAPPAARRCKPCRTCRSPGGCPEQDAVSMAMGKSSLMARCRSPLVAR
jgi:hypothetical protein